jgi:hypothetical protein
VAICLFCTFLTGRIKRLASIMFVVWTLQC